MESAIKGREHPKLDVLDLYLSIRTETNLNREWAAMQSLKQGDLMLVEIYSSEDASPCHGFGRHVSMPTVKHVAYLGVASEDTIHRVIDRKDGFMLIPTQKHISLAKQDGLDEQVRENIVGTKNGIFLGYISDFNRVRIMEFSDVRDLSNKLRDARSNVCYTPLRGGDFEEGVLSINIYLGNREHLVELMTSDAKIVRMGRSGTTLDIDPFRANRVLTGLEIAVPDSLKRRLNVAAEKEVLDFYREWQKPESRSGKGSADLTELINKLNAKEVSKFAPVVTPSTGVTIDV